MAWLTSCSDDNKIIQETNRYWETYSIAMGGGISYTFHRQATRTTFEYVGITKDAADAQELVEIAADPSVGTRVYRPGDSDEYRLAVTSVSYDPWTEPEE
jgi:hypothetical protein